ncbi:MAG: hypothetical protein ABFD50_22535, partial [Smithella sp.]
TSPAVALYIIIDGREKSMMGEVIMVEVVLNDIPDDIYQNVKTYADNHNISPDEAASIILNEQLENRVNLEYLEKLWDIGFNSEDKLSKMIDIVAAYAPDVDKIKAETKLLIDDAEPELPYNPYTRILKWMDYKSLMQIIGQNCMPQGTEYDTLSFIKESSIAKRDTFAGITYAFNYGMICGKRAERKRRGQHND